jgi:hypothetical protein
LGSDLSRERIAILLGIPVTRDEFYEMAANPRWDYGRQLLSGRCAAKAFEQIYEPVCTVASELRRRAELGNVTVCLNTSLRDLRSISSTHDVLVIVAHWRSFVVEVADLLEGWSVCLEQAAGNDVLYCLSREISRRFGAAWNLRDGSLTKEGNLRGHVVVAMNDLINTGKLIPFLPATIGSITTHSLITKTLSRDLLDEAFGGALQRGNQLELADGLHAVEAIHTAIDPAFRGVIDLSCCTSSVLGTYLKLVRGDTLQVIMGDHLIVPAPQLRLIERTLELLTLQTSARYVDAKMVLVAGLGERHRNRPATF